MGQDEHQASAAAQAVVLPLHLHQDRVEGVPDGGRESLVVVAEARDADPSADVRSQVAARVRDVVGMPAEEVVLVRPGTLPKTSSGKLQRTLCRERYLGEQLEPIA